MHVSAVITQLFEVKDGTLSNHSDQIFILPATV